MSAPPLPSALGHAAAAVRPFRTGGRTQLAVVVKATFRIAHKRAMAPLPPVPVIAADLCPSADPRAPITAAAETAPYLQRADVLLSGHACAPGRQAAPIVSVRLRIGMGATVTLDKTVHAYGDRRADGRGAPQPFLVMPLTYDRAFGGMHDPENPAGVDVHTRPPNLIDPQRPGRAAGFGPIAAHWPVRARRLGTADPRAVRAPWPSLPDPFDWSYFQAAPPDQQIPHLGGREWIVLEGFHPEAARVETWLPGAVAEARLHLPGTRAPQALSLLGDMLVIDTDHWTCSFVWRATPQIPEGAALAGVRVATKVSLPGEDIPWDDAPSARSSRARPASPSVAPPRPASPSVAPPRPATSSSAPPPADATVTLAGATVSFAGSGLPFSGAAVALAGQTLVLTEAAPPPADASTTLVGAILPFTGSPLPFAAQKTSLADASVTLVGAVVLGPTSALPDAALPFSPSSPGAALPLAAANAAANAALPFAAAALPFAAPVAMPVEPPSPPRPTSPWAAGAPAVPRALDASPPVAFSSNAPSPAAAAAPAVHPVPQPARRARRLRPLPGEPTKTSAPLVPPHKRRPARVGPDGLGAQFLRSVAPASPGPSASSVPSIARMPSGSPSGSRVAPLSEGA